MRTAILQILIILISAAIATHLRAERFGGQAPLLRATPESAGMSSD